MIAGFGNNVVSSLASDITASQTAIPVMPGTGEMFANLLTYDFDNPSNTLPIFAKITLSDAEDSDFEVCHLLSVSGDTLNVLRGQEGTQKGWLLHDAISNFATRGSENLFVQLAHLQSGHYTSGIAGGTGNALTLELPTTFFLNGSIEWALKTPVVVYPPQNNTGPATLQLTMGGRVLGIFPLKKVGGEELVAGDIIEGIALVCLLDVTKTFFSVVNPGVIFSRDQADGLYLQIENNLSEIAIAGTEARQEARANIDAASAVHGHTPEEVGAYPITGGTLKGDLRAEGDVLATGNIMADMAVYESAGQVRVYSANNPPPASAGDAYTDTSLGAEYYISSHKANPGSALTGTDIGSDGVDGIWGKPIQKMVNGVWYTVAG